MILHKSLLALFTIIAVAVTLANGANILGLFTSHSQSHLIVHMTLANTLAAKGHNVTVITGLQPKVKPVNVSIITIPPSEAGSQRLESFMSEFVNKESSPITMLLRAFSGGLAVMLDLQHELLESEQFKKFYNTPDTHFDLVIVGYFFNAFNLGVAAKYNCPAVVSWSGPLMPFLNDLLGNPPELSYVPTMSLEVKNGAVLTFTQRIKNIIGSLPMSVMGLIFDYKAEKFYSKYFGKEKHYRTYDEMKRNVSLVLVNSHFSQGPIRPNVPALIEVGGIQVKDKPDPLPKDIEEFLNKSKKNGAIYFCLGTNLNLSLMDPKKLQAIFNTLAGLKENVIWKWNDMQNLPGKSKNILFKDWLPQDDILAHPNIKLFITHAGQGGVVEAQYHGVPMLALPFFADQFSNAAKMADAGYGIKMSIAELNEENFKAGISEVLNNPKYTENIKKYAKLYRDRPLSAKENAVYWIEYVIRHHGAAHMQSPLVHMNFIERNSLDIIACILLALYIVLKITKFIFMLCIRKIKNSFTKSSQTNKKKKRQ